MLHLLVVVCPLGAPVDANLVLSQVAESRSKITDYTLAAEVEAAEHVPSKAERTRRVTTYSAARSGAKIIVSRKTVDPVSGKTLAHVATCRGCTADGKPYQHHVDDGPRTTASRPTEFVDRELIDLARCGVDLNPVAMLAAGGPTSLTDPGFGDPEVAKSANANEYVLTRTRRDGSGRLTITLDPLNGHRIVTMDYTDLPTNIPVERLRCVYDDGEKGVHFPKEVTYTASGKDFELAETVRFTARRFGPPPADAFTPARVGLRVNAMVQNVGPQPKERVFGFFDGKGTVKSPPDPSEYATPTDGDRSASAVPKWAYPCAAAAALVLAVVFVRKARREGRT